MKKLFYLSLMAGMLAVCCTFTACGDSDDYAKQSFPPVNDKRIVKWTKTDVSSSSEYTYILDYNSKGQIVKVSCEESSGATYSMDYLYSQDNVTISYSDKNYKTTCLLDKGLIVYVTYLLEPGVSVYFPEDPKRQYSYDDNGQLIYNGYSLYTWDDGNIIRESHHYDTLATYSYSEYSGSLLPLFDVSVDDWILAAQGYYGKRCRNLPLEVKSSDGSTTTYDYTVEQGVVTKMVIQSPSSTTVYTFFWE